MSEIGQQGLASERPADDVWRLINMPLTGEIGTRVNPYVTIEYEGLNDIGMIGLGSLVVYRPNLDALPDLGMAADLLPDDVAMRVEEFNPEAGTRLDVLESDKHSGNLRYVVEACDSSLLTIEGELILGGSRKMFSSMVTPYAERALREHYQRVLNNADTLLS